MSTLDELRRRVLLDNGAGERESTELLAYSAPSCVPATVDSLPLPDEPFVAAWAGYAAAAKERGAVDVLRDCIVQLRFPIAAGMSADDAYRRATRRGEQSWGDQPGVVLERPDLLRVFLHSAPAGRIPVIAPGTREDFVTMLQAVMRQNEPVDFPKSCGAYMIAGYNNWDRVGRLREAWLAEGGDPDGWPARFRELKPQKELYQDRFVLVSSGPYSDVPASAIGIQEEEWQRLSFAIRLEHECAHYFTRRVFGWMRESLYDELMADYAGIVAASGRFRADWFLRFLGLENFPMYREGGRMQNYLGTPPISSESRDVLERVVRAAALNLERFDDELPESRSDVLRAQVLRALAHLTFEELASADGAQLLHSQLSSAPHSGPAAVGTASAIRLETVVA